MITDEQIRQLKHEALAHGDRKQAEICDRALTFGEGSEDARAECARVIAAARAMRDRR